MYEYNVKRILKVVDADTVDAEIDLGFGIRASLRFRLAGIDAPEIFGKDASAQGHEAVRFVEEWFASAAYPLTIRTFKGADAAVGIGDGAFGRWKGDLRAGEASLSAALIEAGLGVESQ